MSDGSARKSPKHSIRRHSSHRSSDRDTYDSRSTSYYTTSASRQSTSYSYPALTTRSHKPPTTFGQWLGYMTMTRSSGGGRGRGAGAAGHIETLEYRPRGEDERSRLLAPNGNGAHRDRSQDTSVAGSFFEQVAEGVQERDREKMKREVVRYVGFLWAIVNTLCAGSITAFSLYGPLFLSHLKYTQLQVNAVSITAELGMYLPVPIFGYLCDRMGPGWCSLLSGTFFGFGYLLAAFTYRSGPDGWPFGVMILAFVFVGMGTSCMYMSATTTCAKNFGRGKFKGIALAVPIASFGLSGMWLSQVGDAFFQDRSPGTRKGAVDVYRFFIFLGVLLLTVGIIGTFTLRIVDETELIDKAIEDIEESGILDDDSYFRRASLNHGYGTVEPHNLSDSTYDFLQSEADALKSKAEEDQRRKTRLLNAETRRFLQDRTMWFLAAGFFLVTGPGEAFINNLGTIIGTLYPPSYPSEEIPTSAATHVSIVAVTSTLARLFTGTLTDILAPTSDNPRRSLQNSLASLATPTTGDGKMRFTLSRIPVLLLFALLLSLGQIVLASGVVQTHAERFAWVSSLIGAGYGAAFSLVPIVISVVWGVENFGTNWGVVATMPAGGAFLWGVVYSLVYERGVGHDADGGAGMCCGQQCYAPTFWGMAACVWLAMALWAWAWLGPGGWRRRGVAV